MADAGRSIKRYTPAEHQGTLRRFSITKTVTRPAQEQPVVVLTGASGYIGRHLTAALLANGYRVRALVRTPATMASRAKQAKWAKQEGVAVRGYQLDEPPAAAAFAGAYAVVHAAFDASGALSDNAELEAAKRLLARADGCGARKFLFLSSIEARPGATSAYARRKHDIEQVVLANAGTVVRPGLVYGGDAGGLFATLDNVAKGAPLIPAFLPAPRVQPIHVDDLCAGIAKALADGQATGVYTLAQERSLTLTAFLRQLAWRRHRRLLPAVWLPAAGVRLLTNVAAALRVLPRRQTARLQGLFAMRTKAADDAETRCGELGVAPRPLAAGLRKGNGKFRDVLEEANALTRYVAGRRASPATLARYAKVVAAKRGGKALDLPVFCRAFPPAIRCIDPKRPGARRNPALSWRLDVALALCEVDVRLGPRFHLRANRSWFVALCELGAHAFVDLLLMPYSWAARRQRGAGAKNNRRA